MSDDEKEINEVFNIAVYIQFIGSFSPKLDFKEVLEITNKTYEYLKENETKIIINSLPEIRKQLNGILKPLLKYYPPKKSINDIATSWNDLFKEDKTILNYGISYGWLEEQIDLKKYSFYDYTPYHFRIGLGAHKGHFDIEENFLLKDAFNALIKAESYNRLLLEYGQKQKKIFEDNKKMEFDKKVYSQITNIKYEVAAFSRLSIISFYAFVESFVNSIAYDYLKRNEKDLDIKDRELLKGFKNKSYISLKSKIEIYQKIIRKDKKAVHITTDLNQIKEPFKSFFDYYEELRNASVHFAPNKEKIWLRPNDWITKAKEFSEISIHVSSQFWKSCHECSEGPQYLGKLDYKRLHKIAVSNLEMLQNIEFEILKK